MLTQVPIVIAFDGNPEHATMARHVFHRPKIVVRDIYCLHHDTHVLILKPTEGEMTREERVCIADSLMRAANELGVYVVEKVELPTTPRPEKRDLN